MLLLVPEEETGRWCDIVMEFKLSEVLEIGNIFFSSSLFYNSFDIHEFVWGIYKQSAYFSILYQVSKGLFNKSLTTQRAITEIEIMKRRKGCSLEYIILQ